MAASVRILVGIVLGLASNAVGFDPFYMPCKMSPLGQEFTGHVSITREGQTCQRWDAQHPHEHSRTDPEKFPENSISDAENYCRNPDNEDEGPWCYTTDPDVRWQYCDVKLCPKQVLAGFTSTCKLTWFGPEYHGNLSVTGEGLQCQRWDSQNPHEHTRGNADYFALVSDISDVHNYCRNPDGEPEGPWCYTTDPDTRWQYCDVYCCVPGCDDPENHKELMMELFNPPEYNYLNVNDSESIDYIPYPEYPDMNYTYEYDTPTPDYSSATPYPNNGQECFQVKHDTALFGHNTRSIKDASLEECKRECLESTDFDCLSFDYLPSDRDCFLSSESAQTDPAMLGSHHGSDYYENTGECTAQPTTGQSGGSGGGGYADYVCPNSGVQFGDSCYLFFHNDGSDWFEAREKCIKLGNGYRLVSIESEHELNFLDSQSRDNNAWQTELYWTGGKEVNGTWFWDHGDYDGDVVLSDMMFTAWEAGEPNNSGDEGEDHVILAVHDDGRVGFNDMNHSFDLKYICEHSI